jgi:hypothetical protein
MAFLTLADLAALRGSDAVVGLIEDATSFAPEFGVVPARGLTGITYMLTRRTGKPTGAFRDANSAVTLEKSQYTQEVKQMYFLDLQLQTDEAIVKSDSRELGEILTLEARGAMQGATEKIGTQFYYGTSADAKGFAGIQSQSVGKVSAGNKTSATTSAYLVWLDPQGVQFVVGNDGEFAMGEWTKQAVNPTSTTQRMAWVNNMSTFIGLQVGSTSAVWRVGGIHTDSTHHMTDARGAHLLSKVPLNRRQGLRWFMNRTAALTLQLSRTSIGQVYATPSSGGPAFSGFPTECVGIPITVTDMITDTETQSAGTADAYSTE